MEATSSESVDLLTQERDRVRIGPIPDWVTPNSYNPEFTAKVKRSLTPLLLERQAHAERREIYLHHALRLETMQAVQIHSQWRIEFAPKSEWVELHFVKTRRGSIEREHLSQQKLQFLRREAGLEGFSIDGGITLLLLLEDVAVGDVLEFSYTLKIQPPFMPEHFAVYFELPLASEIGKHFFSVRHAATRQLKWKSSSQDLAPVRTVKNLHVEKNLELPFAGPPHGTRDRANHSANTTQQSEEAKEEVELLWQGENVVTLEPEEGMPSPVILYPWMQFSDCPDWQTVARAVAGAWPNDEQGDGLKKLLDEIKNASADLIGRVNEAIKIVQDGFRYLSVNVELGGCIPADPETVIRRRYGDCKDLALLLSRLLHGLGVSARPVLVHTGLRKFVSGLLPSAAFNHAIVEFQIGEERRWIDATMKFQGGSALNRLVWDFGVGLPVDPNATELASVPKPSLPGGTYELKDSFLLDTAGSPSYMGVVVTAKGIYADQLRAEFETAGSAAISKNRLLACANRFYKAARVGEMQWRDDREKNEFLIADVFEIDGFLRKQASSCFFEIRSEVAGALRVPPQIIRRDPFGLPYPCHQTHIVEIDFQGLDFVKIHPYESNSKFFALTRQVRSVQKYLKATFTVKTLMDVVPANEISEHRKQVETAFRASGFVLQLPLGYARMRKRGDFGALPDGGRGGVSTSYKTESKGATSAIPATLYVPEHLAMGTKAKPVSPVAALDQRRKHRFIDPKNPRMIGRKEGNSSGRYSDGGRHSHSRYNLKCVLSLGLAIVSVWLLIAGIITAGWGLRGAAGTIGLLMIPTVPAAVVLAVLGLRELSRSVRKARGRGMAIASLWISAIMGLILVPMLIGGIKGGLRGYTRAKERIAYAKLLKFPAEQFVIHTPERPWIQVDVKNFAVVGFAEPGPISSIVVVTNLGRPAPEFTGRLVEWCKESERRFTNPWRIIGEGPTERNGVRGWQFESTGYYQGHEVYSVTWVVMTNGFGYMLRTSSRWDLRTRTKEGADYIFSRFEPMAPGQMAP
jgi:hypothetical protein